MGIPCVALRVRLCGNAWALCSSACTVGHSGPLNHFVFASLPLFESLAATLVILCQFLPFWTNLNTWSHFRNFLLFGGNFGYFQAKKTCLFLPFFDQIWPIYFRTFCAGYCLFRSVLANFRHFWPSYATFGQFLPLLVAFGYLWLLLALATVLVKFCLFWRPQLAAPRMLLGAFGDFWPLLNILAASCRFWPFFTASSCFWSLLPLLGTLLTTFGHFCLLLCFFRQRLATNFCWLLLIFFRHPHPQVRSSDRIHHSGTCIRSISCIHIRSIAHIFFNTKLHPQHKNSHFRAMGVF